MKDDSSLHSTSRVVVDVKSLVSGLSSSSSSSSSASPSASALALASASEPGNLALQPPSPIPSRKRRIESQSRVETTMAKFRRRQSCRRGSSSSTTTTFVSGLVLLLVVLLWMGGVEDDGGCGVVHVVQAVKVLKQVHVITRHGSRLPLVKNPMNLQESTRGTLTMLGQKQMYDLGRWIKGRYSKTTATDNNNNNTNITPTFFDEYNPIKVRFESSSLDRTIVSANSMALGLFDTNARDPFRESLLPSPSSTPPANIPVYTYDGDDDITIRAYDKCPDGLKLDRLYDSEQWQVLETENIDLLVRLAKMPDFAQYKNEENYVSLSDLWNVYDAIHVAKTECEHAKSMNQISSSSTTSSSSTFNSSTTTLNDITTVSEKDEASSSSSSSSSSSTTASTPYSGGGLSSTCDASSLALLDKLNPDDWTRVEKLSHTAEILKYSNPQQVGKYIGGNLLLQILERMEQEDAIEQDTTTTSSSSSSSSTSTNAMEGFYVYSAHYPTILGIFAALNEKPIETEVIPNYATGVLLELYKDTETNVKTIEIVYKPGGPDDHETMKFHNACQMDGYGNDSDCVLHVFASYLRNGYSRESWCHDCQNTVAAFCARAKLNELITQSIIDDQDKVAGANSAASMANSAFDEAIDLSHLHCSTSPLAANDGMIGFLVGALAMVCAFGIGLTIFLYCNMTKKDALKEQQKQGQKEQQGQVQAQESNGSTMEGQSKVGSSQTSTSVGNNVHVNEDQIQNDMEVVDLATKTIV